MNLSHLYLTLYSRFRGCTDITEYYHLFSSLSGVTPILSGVDTLVIDFEVLQVEVKLDEEDYWVYSLDGASRKYVVSTSDKRVFFNCLFLCYLLMLVLKQLASVGVILKQVLYLEGYEEIGMGVVVDTNRGFLRLTCLGDRYVISFKQEELNTKLDFNIVEVGRLDVTSLITD